MTCSTKARASCPFSPMLLNRSAGPGIVCVCVLRRAPWSSIRSHWAARRLSEPRAAFDRSARTAFAADADCSGPLEERHAETPREQLRRLILEGFGGFAPWILGRNMFGPIRGPWPDDRWKGWWGDEPPYHTPVFVLTHHRRPPIKMAGGTEFRFVSEGVHAALDQARAAAGERDVRLGGGVSTIRQYLRARLIDELHLAIRPVLL